LKIGCQGGEKIKLKHEPLKVNFPPFLSELRPNLDQQIFRTHLNDIVITKLRYHIYEDCLLFSSDGRINFNKYAASVIHLIKMIFIIVFEILGM
jgi:hypothetical protein